MNLKRIPVIVLLVVITLLIPAASVLAAQNNVTVRAMLSNDYAASYGNEIYEAETRIWYASFQYHYKWDIEFYSSFVNISPLFIDNCNLPISTLCYNAHCGSPCECDGNPLNGVHHKSITKNYVLVVNSISRDHDLMLTMTSAALCPDGSLGLGGIHGAYSFVTNMTSFSWILKTRIIQHEFSHNFGCHGHG